MRNMVLLAKLAPEADLLASDMVTKPDVQSLPDREPENSPT